MEAFAWSTAGLSCPSWCYWSSFPAVLWNPPSLVVSRVIWASFRGFSLPSSEYFRREKCKAAFSFLALPSVSQSLLGISGYSCLLMAVGTLCAGSIISRTILSIADTSHSHVMTYQKKAQILLGFLTSCFFETLGVRFSILFIQHEKIHFLLSMKTFISTLYYCQRERTLQTILGWGSWKMRRVTEQRISATAPLASIHYARENILALNIICSHCNSCSANITFTKGWWFSNPAEYI